MEGNLRIVRVDRELLRQALRLPDGVEILDARMSLDRDGVLELKISHPDFGQVKDGCVIPWVNPTFNTDGFVSWGDGA